MVVAACGSEPSPGSLCRCGSVSMLPACHKLLSNIGTENSGANVMTYYVVYIFLMAGLTGNVNLIASGVQYALFIVFTTIMFFYIDRIGRRTLLIYGALAMGACHFVVGGILSAGESVPGGVGGNPNVLFLHTASQADMLTIPRSSSKSPAPRQMPSSHSHIS